MVGVWLKLVWFSSFWGASFGGFCVSVDGEPCRRFVEVVRILEIFWGSFLGSFFGSLFWVVRVRFGDAG